MNKQDIRESIFEIAQTARERVKNEAFHKDLDTGKNSLDLTHTREIIIEAINQAIKQKLEEVKEIIIENTPKHITREYRDTDLMRDKILQILDNHMK